MEMSERFQARVLPQRVYSRSWAPGYWRGSVDQLVGAARAVETEIGRQRPGTAQQDSGLISYLDGSEQKFESLTDFEAGMANTDLKEIEGFRITVASEDEPKASARISGARNSGLTVATEGSEAFAAGMVATLKSRLAGGADAGDRAAQLPIQPIECIVPLIPVALAVGLYFYFNSQWTYLGTFSVMFLPVFLLFVAWIAIGGWIAFRREARKPSPLVLVAEGEQFADEGEEKDGPIWRAKGWFDRHPAIRWGGTLIIGAILGAMASKVL
jgi:hypothetical protein